MNKTTIILTLLILISSCKSKLENENIFPEVKNVTELKSTDFVPTLESTFEIKNNIIYGATIPFAWNEIRNEIGTTLTDFSSKQLEEINDTKSYVNVLKNNEYETSVEVDGKEIRAKAYFRKSLPFEEPLTKFDKPLTFGNSSVESFGFWSSCSFAKINYFNDENDFSVTLFPKNDEHEIILILNKEIRSDFKSNFERYNKQKSIAKSERVYFNDDDKVEIPIIEFNLAKSFDKIVSSSFKANETEYTILEALQRNAFILNENGAEVESEVEMAADAVEEIEKVKPKMMIFNRPFVVLLKRKDAENPYFGVYIANDELLKKE
tara:strand:- start:979 stop:1944 length:966 start_codon:yes stop_codon:yes gene_type:complete